MLKRPWLAFVLLAGALLGAAIAGPPVVSPAHAASEPRLTPKVQKLLSEADKLRTDGKFEEALAKIKEAQAFGGLTDYDKFAINDISAVIYVNLQDYLDALAAYEATVNSGFVKDVDMPTRIKFLVQLAFQVKDYPKTISYAERYLKDYGEDLEVMAFECNSYYVQKDDQNAFKLAQRIIQKAEASGQKPKEAWLQLLLYSANSVKNEAAMKKALFGLIEHYPSVDHWHDLLATLHNQPNLTDHYNLDIFRLMLAAKAFKTGDEYLILASSAISAGLPGEAKSIIELGKSRGLLGTNPDEVEVELTKQANNQSAIERKALDSNAARAASTASGNDDFEAGEAYYSFGMPDKAIKIIQDAIAGGKLSRPGDAYLSLGRIYFMQGNIPEAKSTFAKVTSDEKDVELAKAWGFLCAQQMAAPTKGGSNE